MTSPIAFSRPARAASLTSAALVALALATRGVQAHIGIWHPSVYGFDASGPEPEHWFDEPVNTNYLKNPLRLMDNLKFDQWWFHGLIGATPKAVMELPAGGSIMIEHSCNKAWTSYGLVPEQRAFIGDMPCDINVWDGKPHYGDPNKDATNGPMHVADVDDTSGCGLAIAYTDDVHSVKPEDFTVFSVNHTCVWKKETWFQIPEDMPPCPGKKCICSWNWIHGARRMEGYGNELYMNGFDCTVTNSKSTKAVAKPKLPVDCRDDASKCTKGAKQALFWQGAQREGWNIPDTSKPNLPMIPPSYDDTYGWADGAQNDIFGDSDVESSKTASNSSSSSSSDKTAPTDAATNHFAIVDAEDKPLREAAAENGGDDGIYRQVVVKTRTHLATVTADAKMRRQVKAKRDNVLLPKPAAIHAHQRRNSSPHRL